MGEGWKEAISCKSALVRACSRPPRSVRCVVERTTEVDGEMNIDLTGILFNTPVAVARGGGGGSENGEECEGGEGGCGRGGNGGGGGGGARIDLK